QSRARLLRRFLVGDVAAGPHGPHRSPSLAFAFEERLGARRDPPQAAITTDDPVLHVENPTGGPVRPVDLLDDPVAIVGMDQIHERAGPWLGMHVLPRYGLVPPDNLALLRREVHDVGEVVVIEDADLRGADGLTKALFIRAQRQLRRLQSRDVPD